MHFLHQIEFTSIFSQIAQCTWSGEFVYYFLQYKIFLHLLLTFYKKFFYISNTFSPFFLSCLQEAPSCFHRRFLLEVHHLHLYLFYITQLQNEMELISICDIHQNSYQTILISCFPFFCF